MLTCFDVQVAGPRLRPPPFPELRAACAAALDLEGVDGAVTLRIVGVPEMAALNGAYRGRGVPTNVLAFAASSGDLPSELAEEAFLGDVIVCEPVVRDEATRQGKSVRAHFLHLVVHGTLHLLGHDHREPAEAERMEARERSVLAEFGLPDPYLEGSA